MDGRALPSDKAYLPVRDRGTVEGFQRIDYRIYRLTVLDARCSR
jgi:hypothetical protein